MFASISIFSLIVCVPCLFPRHGASPCRCCFSSWFHTYLLCLRIAPALVPRLFVYLIFGPRHGSSEKQARRHADRHLHIHADWLQTDLHRRRHRQAMACTEEHYGRTDTTVCRSVGRFVVRSGVGQVGPPVGQQVDLSVGWSVGR